PIDQTRFPNVRRSHNRERETLVNELAVSKAGSKGFERHAKRRHHPEDRRIGKNRDVVLRKVDARLELCDQLHQIGLDWLESLRERPFELLRGDLRLK